MRRHLLKVLITIILFMINIDGAYGDSSIDGYSPSDGQNNEFGSYGLPTKLLIAYSSDFPSSQTASVGHVYFEWTITVGSEFYSSSSATITDNTDSDTAGILSLDLTRSATNPTIGVHIVKVDVDMKYKNTATIDVVMHQRSFTFTVDVVGLTSSERISTTSGVSTTNYVALNTEGSNSATVASDSPGDLSLSAGAGAPFTWPSAIVLKAHTIDTKFHVWLDTSAPIEVKNVFGTTVLYTWPSLQVSALTAEAGTSNTLTITLNSVPVTVYNMGTVYFHVTVRYRNTAGDQRNLRGLEGESESGTVKLTGHVDLRSSNTVNSASAPVGTRCISIILALTLAGVGVFL